jgi:glycosyltransferase involved in cell wall biosynthesis
MAAKCPIITGRSQASDNFFIDKDDVVLAKMADSQDLADKILLIKNNKELSNKISDNAYQLFQKTSTPKILGRELLNTINEIL